MSHSHTLTSKEPLLIFCGALSELDQVWTNNNNIVLWLNVLLLWPRGTHWAFGQVHPPVVLGKWTPSLRGVVCCKPMPFCVPAEHFLKTGQEGGFQLYDGDWRLAGLEQGTWTPNHSRGATLRRPHALTSEEMHVAKGVMSVCIKEGYAEREILLVFFISSSYFC